MINIILISIALAMDAFSVAICIGASLTAPGMKKPLLVGLYFGFFQSAMALIGWLGGAWAASKIGGVDHWIAFVILAVIGGNMIVSFLRHSSERACFSFRPGKLSVLALATSLDALGAGASLALIDGGIVLAVATIGLVAFAFSFFGVWAGRMLTCYIRNYAELFGGVLLILIGLGVLAEHGVF